jgi:hypothetical protein
MKKYFANSDFTTCREQWKMGNDGGTIAKRQDLLSLRKPVQREALEDDQVNVCAVSYMPLTDPVVGDYKGFLYRKDKLIEYILGSKTLPDERKEELNHISSLNDVIDVKVTWKNLQIVCPVTETVRTKKIPFAYLRPCGCLMAYKLLEKIRGQFRDLDLQTRPSSSCPNCGRTFHFDYDVVKLGGSNEENHQYVTKVLREYHSGKKRKLKEKRKESKESKESKEKRKTLEPTSGSGTNPAKRSLSDTPTAKRTKV